MKRNFWKKILFCVASLGMVTMLTVGVMPVKAIADEEIPDYAAKADDYYSYVQKFEDVDAVNNAFHAYYRENALVEAFTSSNEAHPEISLASSSFICPKKLS